MSTTSLALLKGANKAALENELAEGKDAAVEAEAENTAPAEEAVGAQEVELTAEDINKMTGKELDELVKENEVPVPDNWSKMKVPDKKAFLIDMMSEEEGTADAEADTPAEEPEAEPEAPAPEPETPAPVVTGKAETAKPKSKTVNVVSKVGKALVAVQTKEGEILGPDAIADIAHELSNMKETPAKELARQLLEAGEQSFFKLGGVLAHIQDNGWYQPYPSFKDFVQGEYGIQYRRAMYFISIYNDIIASGIPYEKVKDIGWTKLKEIASVLTTDTVDKWVELAKNNTALQLADLVSQAKKTNTALPSSQKSEITSKTFKLHNDQKELVEEALSKAKGASGTEVDAVALELICTEYVNTGASKPKAVTTAQVRNALKEMGVDKALEVFAEAFPDVDLTAAV